MTSRPFALLVLLGASACQNEVVAPAQHEETVAPGTTFAGFDLPARELAPPPAAADCTGVDYDAWRSWTPRHNGAPRTLVAPAAGFLDGAIVVQGGRASVTTLNNVSGQTFVLPAPTCDAPVPDWKTVTITSGTAPRVWGAASAVAARRLFVVGGTGSGAGACLRTTSYFEFTSDDHTSGRWVTLAALLPQGLCQASANVLVDAGGKEWLVLAGGSTRSLPNTSCAGGFAPAARTLVLDPAAAAPAWIEHGLGDDTPRWGGASGTSADRRRAFLFGGSSATTRTRARRR